MLTVADALHRYVADVGASRSQHTHKAYRQAADAFARILTAHDCPPTIVPVADLSPEWMIWFIESLRSAAPATERLYLTAIHGFYEYATAEDWVSVNLPTLKQIRQRRARREATRLPPFPHHEIAQVLRTVEQAPQVTCDTVQERLRNLRDRALLFSLADTGLRVAEACSLTRGHLDWQEGRAIVLGKGNLEAVVRFSRRALRFLKLYLDARLELDGQQGRSLAGLPLFARHDRSAGHHIMPLSTRSAEKIVERWVTTALGPDARGSITPHTFRHYFVTMALRGSGGNIRLAQELARHRSITTTQRYTHLSDDELDRGYRDIFDVTET